MKSIQNKILFVVISGLLVITAAVSFIAVTMTHEVMHKDADRILKNATEREAAKINDVLGDVSKSISIMEHFAISEIDDANELLNEEFRTAYLKNAQTMFQEIAQTTSNVAGFFFRLDPAFSNGTTGFYYMIGESGFESMPLTDLTKYAKDDKQNVGWYYSAVNAAKPLWLEPYFFPGVDIELISYVQPLYVGRNLVGVIGIDMNFGYLTKSIEDISLYEDGYAALLAKDGKTAYTKAHPHNEHNHQPETDAMVELQNEMYLVIHAAYKDIQRDIRPMLTNIVLTFLLVLACSIVYTVLVTRKIVGPLKRLTVTASQVSSGLVDLDFDEIAKESNDEIGVLAGVLSETYAKIKEYASYINALAYRDSLTGIKNRTAYTEAIEALNKKIITGKPSFGVLVSDLNNLKETNDRFGHDIGNELLIHTAKILTETFQNSAVFRIGGDEFVVILQGEDYNHYKELIEKLDKACLADYITVNDLRIPISLARGVSVYDPQVDHVYDDIFNKADHAMYLHKQEYKRVFAD